MPFNSGCNIRAPKVGVRLDHAEGNGIRFFSVPRECGAPDFSIGGTSMCFMPVKLGAHAGNTLLNWESKGAHLFLYDGTERSDVLLDQV